MNPSNALLLAFVPWASPLPQSDTGAPALEQPAVAQVEQVESVEATDEDLQRGLRLRRDGAFEGYTLFAPLRSTSTYLIDMDGEVRHVWESDLPPGNAVYLLPDGSLLRCGRVEHPLFHAGGQGGRLQRLAWDGTLLWDHDLATEEHLAHHDVAPLPNGNVLVIAFEERSVDEALAAGRDPRQLGGDGLWPDVVLELEPKPSTGARIVWEWRAWDHLIQDFDSERDHYGSVADRPERIDINGDHRSDRPPSAREIAERREIEREMRALGYLGGDADAQDEDADPDDADAHSGDWLHTNSIDYDAQNDLIVLSVRTFDELWVIDHSTTTAEARGSRGGRWGRGGDLLYRCGNPRAHGAGAAADQILFSQHDASWLALGADEPDGAKRVLVFNNGNGRHRGDDDESSYSSVDELALPFSPERGFGAAPPELTWSWTGVDGEPFFASFISGAQRLPNGNTLVCIGPEGRLVEITRAGEVVWDYANPFGGEEVPLRMRSARDRARSAAERDAAAEPGQDGEAATGEAPDRAPDDGPKIPHGLFRATRLAPDHPGLEGRGLR